MADKKLQDRCRIKRKRKHEVKYRDEQLTNTARRRHVREDEERREAEQQSDTLKRRQAREDEERRDAEQQRDTLKRRQAREDEERREAEQEQDTARRGQKRNESTATFAKALGTFRARNKEGPVHICACCGGLLFLKSVTTTARDSLVKAGCTDVFLDQVIAVKPANEASIILCSTCRENILKSKVPKRALANGLAYPDIPEVLQGLTHLEEILVSPRLAFMMLRELGWDGQYGLKGNIVNIPVDINDTEKVLPRKIAQCNVLHLALMRKLEYKHPYLYETIRPDKVYKACQYLVTTPAYIEECITLSEEWKDIVAPLNFQEAELQAAVPRTNAHDDEDMELDPNESEDEEDTADRSNYPEQTMLIDENDFLSTYIKHAPGEGKRPVSLLWDLNAEPLTFPTIYCGQKRNVNPKLTYAEIAKSEALNADRRGCKPHKLLYAFKKSQQHQVRDSILISLRKRSNMEHITAGNILNPEFVSKLENRNEACQILKHIRSSPAYWEARKKELFATIRQLGIPTFFHTVSAMESHWPELLVILTEILDHKKISEEQAAALPQTDKNDLIRRDPITCARYFDAKTQDYFNLILKTRVVFTNHSLEDYFVRVEFQHRGSPHLHIFLWLKNAPKYDPEDPGYCIPFIDEYISTRKSELSVQFQSHRHTPCCRRIVNGVHICRFGIPYPPMNKTRILTPLSQDFPEGERVLLLNELRKIKAKLKTINDEKQPNMPYFEFLRQLNLTEEKYLLVVRSNLRRTTIFLKREVEAAFLNPYNENLLTAWRSNMDLQYVLDPWACARYLSSYISKAYAGMSTLLRKAAAEMKRGNMVLTAQLKSYGSLFVNKSEVSAQEAAYGILGLQLSKFRRDHVYINTGAPEERSRLTKSKVELEKLSPEDTNILVDELLEHYTERSNDLEEICLADYAALFNYKSTTAAKSSSNKTEKSSLKKIFQQRDGKGLVKRRQFAKIIRSRRYSPIKEIFMYHREQVMLYHPWRDEERDLNTNPLATFIAHSEAIKAKAAEYNMLFDNTDLENIMKDACEAEERDIEIEDQDAENNGVGPTDQNLFDNTLQDTTQRRFLLPGLLPQCEYEDLIKSLNVKQKNYVLHVVHAIKAKSQILEYLGGGAGVGKSTTVRAIVQGLTRFYLSRAGGRPDLLRVLLCAPTGIAAFNIEGKTIHSTFVLPFNQSKWNELTPLTADTRTQITSKLIGIKLIICDELSMVSNQQLLFINKRLQEFFCTEELFGGHSLILVGDLWQLPPIGNKAIFMPLSNGISSLAGSSLWENFRYYELDEVMRQQNDPAFSNALNRMKIGVMTDEDILLLKSREISAFNKPPENIVWLIHFNKEVDEHNDAALAKIKDPGVVSNAVDRIEGRGELDEAGRNKILGQAAALNYQKARGLPFKLVLKLSVRYMVTMNIPNSDMANGAIGFLRHVTVRKNTSGVIIPVTAWIEFPDERTGRDIRQSYRGVKSKAIDQNWTPIEVQVQPVMIWEGKQVRVMRKQFPLTPAEAITIYKSQSQSFTEMVLTVHPGITRTLLYVGCSRARTSSGLWINGTFVPPKKFNITDNVYQAYDELRKKPVLLSHLQTPAPKEGMVSILFYNIEHYGPHKSDFNCLLETMKPTIVALVETHTFSNHTYELSGYQLVQRSDQNEAKTSGYGTACFSTLEGGKSLQSFVLNCKNGHVQVEVISYSVFVIVYGYASPKTNFLDIQSALTSVIKTNSLLATSTIIMGDFNMDLNTVAGTKLKELMKSFGMLSCLPLICSTTKSGTQIDCIFSGIPGLEAYISTSLSSHHDPVQVFVPVRNCKERGKDEDLLESLIKLQLSPNYKADLSLSTTKTETPSHLDHPAHSVLSAKQRSQTSKGSHFGLLNPGNICFANASIQALRPIFEDSKNLELSEHCIYSELLELYKNMRESTDPQVVTPLLQSVRASDIALEQEQGIDLRTDFTDGHQHDAVEFIEKLLDKLHSDAVMYSANSEAIESTFRISVVDHVKSMSCLHHQQEHRTLWSLALPVSSSGTHQDLDSLLQEYLRKSSTADRTCSRCPMRHSMLQYSCFDKLPQVLILRVSRLLSTGVKFEKAIDVPQELHITLKSKNRKFYHLRAAIRHDGTREGGHYIGFTKQRGKENWTEYNDANVSAVQDVTSTLNRADILVYEEKPVSM